MNTRKHLFSIMALGACMGLALTTSVGDDLGKKKGGGGEQRGGGSSGGSSGGSRGSGEQGRRGGGSENRGGGSENRGGGGNSGGNSSGDQGGRRGGGGGSGDQGGGRRGGGSSDDGGRRGGGGSNSGGDQGGRSSGGGSSNDGGRRGGGDQGGEIRSGGTRIILPNGGNNNGGDALGKRGGQSRSGNVNYGGSNNNGRSRDRNGGPVTIGRAPVDVVRGSLGNQVRRADEIRVGNARIRFGYTHYDSRWCDDYFYYPYYAFDPYRNNVVCSPWYYYPQLPPYYVTTHCTFIQTYIWSPFIGVRYNWSPPRYNDGYYDTRRNSDVDYVLDDLTNAFERNDRRAAGRLVPRGGRVAIIIDGQYAYSINSDDFYDTFMDAINNTRTTDYKILDVQTRRDTIAVQARHDYEDPWGRRVSVYHYFRLEQDGRDWVIREFGTSGSR